MPDNTLATAPPASSATSHLPATDHRFDHGGGQGPGDAPSVHAFDPNYTDCLAMALPDELKKRRQFLLWKAVPDPGKPKPRKVPYYASGVRRNGTQGNDTDRANLVTFSQAVAAYEKSGYNGIGIAMLPGCNLVGIDGDNCYDGNLKPEVASLIKSTYAEVSPSGQGVRAFYLGTYGDHKNHELGIEVFCEKGFLTLTGEQLNYNGIVDLPDSIRAQLHTIFADSKCGKQHTEQLKAAFVNDPIYQHLYKNGLVKRTHADGKVDITCPFESEHTTASGDGDCSYFLPHTGGYKNGHFHCFHAHCSNRTREDFLEEIGYQPGPTYDERAEKTKAQSADQTQKSSTFNLVHAGSIEVKAPEFLVKPLLEKDSLSLSFGDPGSCKSFFGIDLALSIATGTNFHGLKVKQGPVIYIAGEGQSGLIRRFMAWSIVRGVKYKEHPVYLSMVPAALCDVEQVQHVEEAIKNLSEAVGPPALIVFDTVARNFGPGDENSTADMTRFIASADKIRALYGSCVHLILHTGHADKSRARGSIALKGGIDAEYRLEKDQNGVVRVEATKMKDAPKPEPMAFELRQVDLPLVDEDGDTVTSAVLNRIDYEPPRTTDEGGLGKRQSRGLQILHELYEDHRQNIEKDGRDPEQARVYTKDWRDACFKAGMDRNQFWRIKNSLAEKGVIRVDGYHTLLVG